MKTFLLFLYIFTYSYFTFAKNIPSIPLSFNFSPIILDSSQVNSQKDIVAKDISKLPLRDFKNIITLTPGIMLNNGNIYLRGSRADETGFFLEGIDTRDKLTGEQNITIVPNSINKIKFNTGGYSAKYGGFNGGYINTEIKTGSPKLKFTVEYVTDNLNFKSKSKRFDGNTFLGAYSYGYNEFTATASGPLFGSKIKFFALINSNWKLDKNPRPFPGINLGTITDNLSSTPETNSINLTYPAGPTFRASQQTYTGTAKLTIDLNPLKINVFGTYTHVSGDRGGGGNILQILDLNRIGINRGYNAAASVQLSHQLNPTTFYQLNAGYSTTANTAMDPLLKENWMDYGDSAANANAGAVWYRTNRDIAIGRLGTYQRPTPYNIFGFSFTAPNDILGSDLQGGFEKTKRSQLFIKGFIAKKLNQIHTLSFGGEFNTNTYRKFYVFAPVIAKEIEIANNLKTGIIPIPLDLIIYRWVNSYGYDVFGNEVNDKFDPAKSFLDKGIFAPRRPKFGALFIEDKIKYDNVIMNVGLRYDYIDVDNIMPVNPAKPETFLDFTNNYPIPSGLKKSPSFSTLSPRVSISYALPNNYILHSQVGRYIQQSRLSDMYNGVRANIAKLNSDGLVFPKAWYLKPVKTTQFEIGFTKFLTDFASIDITAYYKNIQDLVVFAFQNTEAGSFMGAYPSLVNGESATSKGIDISFYLRRTKRLQVNAFLSIQSTLGSGADAYSQLLNRNFNSVNGDLVFQTQNNFQLDFNRIFSGNIDFDYRFSDKEDIEFLSNLGINALFTFASGHPYTLSEGKGDANGTLESDPRFRSPVGEINSSVTPRVYQVNLKIDKTFKLFDKIRVNLYLFVINLFNRKNIQNVFLRTGSPFNDGYLSDPALGGTLYANQRKDYENLYKAVNIDYYQNYQRATGNSLFGPPMQIRFGIRLEY